MVEFTRLNPYRDLPDAFKALSALEAAVAKSGLDPGLLDLVRTRVSQLNGCAFCLDMHTHDARKRGEKQQRLDVLPAWREVSLFDARERAALGLAESLTLVATRGFSEAAWEEAHKAFQPAELSALLFAIASINSWNRIQIAGGGQPPKRDEAAS